MNDPRPTDKALYNLEGGPRRVVLHHGVVKAVAPGLRLVDATEEEAAPLVERERVLRREEEQEEEYGLPV